MSLYQQLDPVLIAFYRMTGIPIVDYLLGTFLLALATVVLGEFTLSWVLRLNRPHLEKLEGEITRSHDLSIQALREKDKTGFRLMNREANDAFGRYFFTMVAYSAGVLWPAPFALAWMQIRFTGVAFEFVHPLSRVLPPANYVTTFILVYILARILFKNLRRHLPYFRGVQKMLDEQAAAASRSRSRSAGAPAEAEDGFCVNSFQKP